MNQPNLRYCIVKMIVCVYVCFFTLGCDKDSVNIYKDPFVDSEGNEYPIGKLCDGRIWMLKNLQISTFRNGDTIPYVFLEDWEGLPNFSHSPACCIYADSLELKNEYGLLYNGYTVLDARGLAPLGWHIPTLEEWQRLIDCNGGNEIAGDRLKEAGTAHWKSDTGNNMSGFNALPGSRRLPVPVDESLGEVAVFWTAAPNEECFDFLTPYYGTHYAGPDAYSNCGNNDFGFSVRCIKDE